MPELASRAHQQNIVPTVQAALVQAGVAKEELNGIAFTAGPGLLGSLLVGTSFAKSMALALGIPLLPVHHMRAHVLAHLIEEPGLRNPDFPFLCLTVSGGHTQILRVNSPYDLQILGETLDDAAGEAFDKGAKLLGLPYPGGPLIDQLAVKGDPERFSFSEPQIAGLDFSFSGLKTSFLYTLQRESRKNADFVQRNRADLAASYQATILRVLINKLEKAVNQEGIRRVAIAGGVAANRGLRKELAARDWDCYLPPLAYCTDNAAMIGIAGYYDLLAGKQADQSVRAQARMPIDITFGSHA